MATPTNDEPFQRGLWFSALNANERFDQGVTRHRRMKFYFPSSAIGANGTNQWSNWGGATTKDCGKSGAGPTLVHQDVSTGLPRLLLQPARPRSSSTPYRSAPASARFHRARAVRDRLRGAGPAAVAFAQAVFQPLSFVSGWCGCVGRYQRGSALRNAQFLAPTKEKRRPAGIGFSSGLHKYRARWNPLS